MVAETERIYWQDDTYLARLVEESYVRGGKRGRVKNKRFFFFFSPFFEPVDGGLEL